MTRRSAVISIPWIVTASVWLALAGTPATTTAQPVSRVIVDIRTADERFAGTDDPMQLSIAGQTFDLDNPDHDDFERNNTDRFDISVPAGRLTVEQIRGVGVLSVAKLEDSFFGGGWAFGGITVWLETDSSTPLYQNGSVDVWLDGGRLVWSATIDDPGWTFPEPPPPFPPCTIGDVDTGLLIDSDCDGIPDDSDDIFNPVDSDGDGLPDRYEEGVGTNPTDSDSDDDGWSDGGNRRSFLVLRRIQCLDEEEDVGRDEIYVVAEEARYPLKQSLDGSWPMDDNSDILPAVIVDTRVSAPAAAGGPPLAFRTRLRLREGDPTVFEGPTDDNYKVFEITWGESGTFEIVHQGDDEHYVLEFRSFTVVFADANPLADTADTDADGLSERKEFEISAQDPAAQATVIDGYNGLADPAWRDLFVEIDAVGDDNAVPYDAKQMVVSQFRYRNYSLRIDDGYLGGGQELSYEETLTLDELKGPNYKMDPNRFAPQRRRHFRYGLFSDRVEGEGSFGVGSIFDPVGGGFIVAEFHIGALSFGHMMTAEYTPILIMHEMGHTFGLCHRFGDRGDTAPGSCPAPDQTCGRYCDIDSTRFVDQSSDTAMGSDTTFDLIVEIGIAGLVGAATGATLGAIIGGAIGGLPGAIVGGILGGLLGGLFTASQADPFTRFVDYDPIEWSALQLWP